MALRAVGSVGETLSSKLTRDADVSRLAQGVCRPEATGPPADCEVGTGTGTIEELQAEVRALRHELTGCASEWEQRITRDEHPCLSDALFIPGFDAGAAAVHDATALADGQPARLTYLGKEAKKEGLPRRPRPSPRRSTT
jgi:hypothetical protein